MLIEILLFDGEIDDAWAVASEHGCEEGRWVTLAAARQNDHPLDAIPIYQRAALAAIDTKNNKGYATAVDYLGRIRQLAQRAGDRSCSPADRRDPGDPQAEAEPDGSPRPQSVVSDRTSWTGLATRRPTPERQSSTAAPSAARREGEWLAAGGPWASGPSYRADTWAPSNSITAAPTPASA